MLIKYALLFLVIAIASCSPQQKYDTIIRNGTVYDGNGGKPYKADVAINADTIAFIGDLKNAFSKNEVDAEDKAVAPGFINTSMIENIEREKYIKGIPAGRIGEPVEVAHLVSFLASEKSSYITGEVININGGLYS